MADPFFDREEEETEQTEEPEQEEAEVTTDEPEEEKEEAEAEEGGEEEAEAEGGEEPEAEAEAEDGQSEEPKPEEGLYTVKIDGEEKRVSLDDLVRGYQRERGSNKRFQEARKIQQQVQQAVRSLLNEDQPLSGLEQLFAWKLGDESKARELINREVERRLSSRLEDEQLTDEQRELKRLRQEKEDMERRLRQQREEKELEESRKSQRSALEQVREEAREAFKEVGLPFSDYTLARAAQQVVKARDEEGYDLTIADAARIVKKAYFTEVKEAVESLPPGEFKARFPDLYKSFQKHNLEEAKKKARTTRRGKTAQPEEPTRPRKRRRGKPAFSSWEEFAQSLS